MLMSLSIDCVSCEKGTKDVSSLFCGREMPCILDRWRVMRTGTLIRMRKKKKQSQSSQLDPSNPIERSVTSLIFLEKINQVHQLLFFLRVISFYLFGRRCVAYKATSKKWPCTFVPTRYSNFNLL